MQYRTAAVAQITQHHVGNELVRDLVGIVARVHEQARLAGAVEGVEQLGFGAGDHLIEEATRHRSSRHGDGRNDGTSALWERGESLPDGGGDIPWHIILDVVGMERALLQGLDITNHARTLICARSASRCCVRPAATRKCRSTWPKRPDGAVAMA
jgi:hypothetical protein